MSELKKDIVIGVVEDDLLFSTQLEFWLRETPHTLILLSRSVEEMDVRLDSMHPDIIFLDNHLPGQNGVEYATRLKQEHSQVLVILMSANFQIKDISKGLEDSVDYIVSKQNLSQEVIDEILIGFEEVRRSKKSLRSILEPLTQIRISHGRKRVLIFEDDELFAFKLSWKLNELSEKIDSLTYDSHKSFLDDKTVKEPALVFLDYRFKNTNGLTILKDLRKRWPRCQVIVLSGQTELSVAEELAQFNILGYIEKNTEWEHKVLLLTKEILH